MMVFFFPFQIPSVLCTESDSIFSYCTLGVSSVASRVPWHFYEWHHVCWCGGPVTRVVMSKLPPHSLPQYAALTGDQCFVFLPPVTWRFITVFPQVVGFIFLEDGGICWRHCCVTTYCGALTGLSKLKFMDMLLIHSRHLSRPKQISRINVFFN